MTQCTQESLSSKVALDDEDPDLIDALLRFIYAKGEHLDGKCFVILLPSHLLTLQTDIDITKLKDGKDVPALCVQIFRLGDFFLLDELKQKAKAELTSHMGNMPVILDTETSNGKCPQWLSEILDALDEAYKDRSTQPILKPLLHFMYIKSRKIFRCREARALLDKTPQMASDLMTKYIVGDLVTQPRTRGFWEGLPVYAAVQFPHHVYEPSNEDLGAEATKAPCRLQHDEDKNSRSRPFIPTDPETGSKLATMRWITPYPGKVVEMGSSPDSAIVSVEIGVFPGSNEILFVRFDDCEDAKRFIGMYWLADGKIKKVEMDSAILAQEMSSAIAKFQKPFAE